MPAKKLSEYQKFVKKNYKMVAHLPNLQRFKVLGELWDKAKRGSGALIGGSGIREDQMIGFKQY